MKLLAIESSCDETAAALVEDGRIILKNEVVSQIPVHERYGGVVPEIASRCHIEAIEPLVERALGGITPDAIAVTYAPGLIGALLVGVNYAKALAFALDRPLIPVHHLRGHVASNYLCHPDLKPPFTALIASGGHSHIVRVNSYTDYEILGKTRDDAAGEAFDKSARILGLGYPGGPKIQKAAEGGNPNAIVFPQVHFKDAPYDFSFSGVKTAVVNYAHTAKQRGEEINAPDLAASFTKAVCEVLTEKSVLAAKNTTGRLVLAGGVSANRDLRALMESECKREGIELYLPRPDLCGDNAAMIGAQGYYEYLAGNVAKSDLNAYATMPVDAPTF
ncbi:MAG: tRNA (adenosine(37)-N6)-threonylcarbamoyltransferase complex transferase subunit TsaD [Clostridia bacterium]|nr:tRNA (adenosine(37)-N6)-threonylcarbamoyltransferase complex transferase subunit TsaD [Clostridia bacterium]